MIGPAVAAAAAPVNALVVGFAVGDTTVVLPPAPVEVVTVPAVPVGAVTRVVFAGVVWAGVVAADEDAGGMVEREVAAEVALALALLEGTTLEEATALLEGTTLLVAGTVVEASLVEGMLTCLMDVGTAVVAATDEDCLAGQVRS